MKDSYRTSKLQDGTGSEKILVMRREDEWNRIGNEVQNEGAGGEKKACCDEVA